MKLFELMEVNALLQSANVAGLSAEQQVEFVRCASELAQVARDHESERVKLLEINHVRHDQSGRPLQDTAEQRAAIESFAGAYQIMRMTEVEFCNRLSHHTISTIVCGSDNLNGAMLIALYKLEKQC